MGNVLASGTVGVGMAAMHEGSESHRKDKREIFCAISRSDPLRVVELDCGSAASTTGRSSSHSGGTTAAALQDSQAG